MFNEKIIQYTITFTLWVQTLWNQAHEPYSSIAFQRHQQCSPKLDGFGRSQCHKVNQTILLNNIDKWKDICWTIWDKSEMLLGMC
jgi:hypothetical protein